MHAIRYIQADKLAVLGRLATGVSIIGSQPLLFSGLRESAFSTFKSLNMIPQDVEKRVSSYYYACSITLQCIL
jgi:hypothetical protein